MMKRSPNPEAPFDGLHDHWEPDQEPQSPWWWLIIVVLTAVIVIGLWLAFMPSWGLPT